MTADRLSIRVRWLALALIFACGALHGGGDAPGYDMNSWQALIADDCRHFFDGCNQCRRAPGKAAACTRMACAEYQRPRCLDQPAASSMPASGPTLEYRCDDGKSFSVTRERYVQDDQITVLTETQVMLRDPQEHTLYLLERERSASGEKYVDAGGLELFARGDEAMLRRNDQRLYRNCKAVE